MTKQKLRLWLEQNKVFFEIFSSVLLGIAGIFVAYASYHVSESQLEVSRVATEPHFYVDKLLFRNPETEKFDEEELYLHNVGAPAHNISAKLRSFITVDLFDASYKPVVVPVLGYFPGQFPTNAPTGLIATFRGHLNNQLAAELHFSILDPEKMKGRPFFDHTLFSIVEVSYQNALGQDRKVYFRNTSQISPEAAQHLLNLHEEKQPLELSTITVDSLMAAVNEQGSL